MAAIASSDVTVTIRHRERIGKKVRVMATVAFGNGALTYPSGGVPLPAKSYFRLTSVDAFHIEAPSANGYVYKYDAANHKLRIYQGVSHTHNVKLIGGITATEPVAVQGGDTLGKNAATDRTIAGADSATKGGIVANTAAALDELGTGVAPAAATLYVDAWGKA